MVAVAGTSVGTSTVSGLLSIPENVPDADVVTLLNAAGIGLTRGTNLFTGPVRAQSPIIPHRAVFVLASGGPGPEAYADGTATQRIYSAVQAVVRSNPHDFTAGQSLARQVRAALHHASATGYVDIRAMQSEPIYMGPDEEDAHTWSVNLEMWAEREP